MKSPRDQEIVSWWGWGQGHLFHHEIISWWGWGEKKILFPLPHHEIISWSLGDKLFSFMVFFWFKILLILKLFHHETRRLSRGGGGGKEFCVLTSNYLVSWISFNFNFQRFFKLGF